MTTESQDERKWADVLEAEELELLIAVGLASASLQELARDDHSSEPDLRLRLGQLNEKIRQIEDLPSTKVAR